MPCSRPHLTDLLAGINELEDADDLLLAELTLAHREPPVIDPFHGSLAYSLVTFSGFRSGVTVRPEQRTAAAIREAVRAVLGNPAYRRSAERVRDEMAALPGPEYGVELLERLVKERRPLVAE